jgi:hypothetical protein
MKNLIYILLVFLFFGCKNETNVEINPNDITKMEFEQTTYDFGTISQGEQVSVTFKFKNTGDKPLVIKEVTTSCGCTATSYSKKPVTPGSEGFIKVTFNSAGKRDSQHKSIIILANTEPERNELFIKGTVTVPENQK